MDSSLQSYFRQIRIHLSLSPDAMAALRANSVFAWTPKIRLRNVCARIKQVSESSFVYAQPVVVHHRDRANGRIAESFLLARHDLVALLHLTHQPSPRLVQAISHAVEMDQEPHQQLALALRAMDAPGDDDSPFPWWGAIHHPGGLYIIENLRWRLSVSKERGPLLHCLESPEIRPIPLQDLLLLEPAPLSPSVSYP